MEGDMNSTRVKDLMWSLDEYPVVSVESTLLDAMVELERAQQKLSPQHQAHRAVLVIGHDLKIVGKIGHLAFLKALDPEFKIHEDLETLSRAGVAPEAVDTMKHNIQFWQDDFLRSCLRAKTIKVEDIMRSVTESIDENASPMEAVHKIVELQTLSLLVTRGTEVIGILRLSDLYTEMARHIQKTNG